MRAIADGFRDELAPLQSRVVRAVVAASPGLATDIELERALELSVRVNLIDLLGRLADPALSVGVGVPPEALTFGTALVRRGVEPEELVHAFMVGQNEIWRAWLEAAARIVNGSTLVAVLDASSARIFGRVDSLVGQLMRHVDAERERWLGTSLARRSEVVHALLVGGDADVREASRALGYDIDRWVLAAVLWDGRDGTAGPPQDAFEALAGVAAQAAGAAGPLTFAPGDSARWVWIATPEEPDLGRVAAALAAALPDGHGAALGTPAHGLEGFRIGHGEAMEARRVAELGGESGVVRYDDVEAVALLSSDRERMARFVRRTLGALATDDDATARLRETVLAWLKEGANARRAADRLHAHKNTVLYRLQRARELLGDALDGDRGNLELALTAMARLGVRAVEP
jgi:DNA-binding PucR family transcriptional regulator